MTYMADDEKFREAIAEQRRREFYAARERVLRGEGHPGEFAEEVDAVLVDENGVPKAAIKYETGAGWVDSAEDHAGEN
jgi:hypothetical protein